MALKAAVALTICAIGGSSIRAVIRGHAAEGGAYGALAVKREEEAVGNCGAGGLSLDDDIQAWIDQPNISIVNGENAKECVWKWQVGLKSRANGNPWCGGMLIKADTVLTAAHCLEGESARGIHVVAGEWNIKRTSGNEQVIRARRLILHRNYKPSTTENDIAIIKLEKAFRLNNCVGLVCVPNSDVRPGTDCWITGWGTLRSGGSSPDILQQGQVKTISERDCKNSGYDSNEITQDMLCAQGNRNGKIVDACQGDSGGPLVCKAGGRWTLYGATSWGQGCASRNYPGVWARVHHFKSWIGSNS